MHQQADHLATVPERFGAEILSIEKREVSKAFITAASDPWLSKVCLKRAEIIDGRAVKL
ncbi:hypothetical protein [Beijerinckia sp. L45]|uniref:hypothetical protein n=1 Tax=Beijerinckia sp. L45 TaxID=1641855 RepID=UPI00131E376B|nr:hypothetical protein [Beijerinckia sp. L45]